MSDVVRLEHGVRAPGQARRWIVQRCREWNCDELVDPAALMVSELVTNVFMHARTNCLVRAGFDFPILAVTVTDGDGDRQLSPQPSSDVGVGGRGLAIVAALADNWGVQRGEGTKSVWFHLDSTNHPHAPTAG